MFKCARVAFSVQIETIPRLLCCLYKREKPRRVNLHRTQYSPECYASLFSVQSNLQKQAGNGHSHSLYHCQLSSSRMVPVPLQFSPACDGRPPGTGRPSLQHFPCKSRATSRARWSPLPNSTMECFQVQWRVDQVRYTLCLIHFRCHARPVRFMKQEPAGKRGTEPVRIGRYWELTPQFKRQA
jgi:hypothetical protein